MVGFGLAPAAGPLKPEVVSVIESYVHQLYAYSDDSRQRCLAAQALGNLSSFIPKKQRGDMLNHAVELGVWGSLVDVLASEEDAAVQEACLVAIAQLLTASPDEDHTSPFKAYLRKLAEQLIRLEVLDQIGWVLTESGNPRVVLAGCRIAAVLSQHVGASNEDVLLASRLIDALVGVVSETNYEYQIRDSAACAISLLSLRECSAKVCKAVYSAGLMESLCLLYQRSIDPKQTSNVVLPGDVAQVMLGMLSFDPSNRWPELSRQAWQKLLRRSIVRSSTIECLASYVAVEAGALRLTLQDTAESILQALTALIEKNSLDLDHLQHRGQQLANQLRMAREEEQEARDAGPAVWGQVQDEILQIKADLKMEIAHVKRAQAPLKWQAERLRRMEGFLGDWLAAHAVPPPAKIKRVVPNMRMLQQTLLQLAALLSPPETVDKTHDVEGEEWRGELHTRLIGAGMLQGVVRVCSAMDVAGQLAAEVSSFVSDMALVPDLRGVLGASSGAMGKQGEQLGSVGNRIRSRIKQLDTEKSKLVKALQYGTAQGSPRKYVQLTDTNALSSGVREDDVIRRLQEVEGEQAQLVEVLGDSEGLIGVLQAHIQLLNDALHSLSEADAKFARAFPGQAGSPSPLKAPAAASQGPSAPGRAGGSPGVGGSPGAAGGGGPPKAGQGMATGAIMEGDGTHPAGAMLGVMCSTLLPITHCATNTEALVALVSTGAKPATGRGLAQVMASLNAYHDPAQPSVRAAGALGGGGSAAASRGGSAAPSAAPSRPASARPGSARRDALGRPIRHDPDSNYGQVKTTHSPMRGYAAPSNGPRYDLSKAAAMLQQASLDDGAHGGRSGRSSALGYADGEGGDGLGWLGPDAPPLTLLQESDLALEAIRNSIMFQPLRVSPPPADAKPAPKDAGSAPPAGPQMSRQASTTSDVDPPAADDPAAQGPPPRVIDALVAQCNALRDLLLSLSALQGYSKGLVRVARSLPAALSFKGVEDPSRLASTMPQLHRLWCQALLTQPASRVQVAEAVTDVAELGVVVPEQYDAVYVSSGMQEGLLKMLAGQLRRGSRDPSAGAGGEGGDAAASPAGASPAGGAASRPHSRSSAPPVLRPSVQTQAEQAAAARALISIGKTHPQALEALAAQEAMLDSLVALCFDHSLAWEARQSAADLLAGLVLAGGAQALAALQAGAFSAFIEMIDRDMYPFYRQDSRGAKVSAVSALAALAASQELADAVVDASSGGGSGSGEGNGAASKKGSGAGSGAPTSAAKLYSIPVGDSDQVVKMVVKALWSVCQQVYQLMTAERTGRGKFVDPELTKALTSTAAASAEQLVVLADTNPGARSIMKSDMRVGSKISIGFLQAIKDPALYEALIALRKVLS